LLPRPEPPEIAKLDSLCSSPLKYNQAALSDPGSLVRGLLQHNPPTAVFRTMSTWLLIMGSRVRVPPRSPC